MKSSDNRLMMNLRFGGLLLLLVVTPFFSFSQEPEKDDDINLLLDDLFFNEDKFIDEILLSLNQEPFLYTSITFNSNTYFSGRDSGINQYNFIPQISYYHPSGFNVGLSGLYYQHFNPNWDFTSVYLGYSRNIGQKELLYFNLGYSHYFYSDGSSTFTNSIDGNIGIRNLKRTLGANLFINYLFGDDTAFQLVPSIYSRISLVKNKNYALKFRPQLNILIAQQTMALEELNNQSNETEFVNYDIFNLLNTELSLPLMLTTKSWNFNIGYNLNFPNPVASESDLKTTSYFYISIGYLTYFKKSIKVDNVN